MIKKARSCSPLFVDLS